MNSCFMCKGPAELYKNKEDKDTLLCECIIDGKKHYTVGDKQIEQSKVEHNLNTRFEKID